MATGCSPLPDDSAWSEDEPAASSDDAPAELGVAAQQLHRSWNSSLWPTHDIGVCWNAAAFNNSSLASGRQTIRFLVEHHIGRVSDLRFFHWGLCPSPLPNTYIQIGFQGTSSSSWGGYAVNNPISSSGQFDPNETMGYHANSATGITYTTLQLSQGTVLHEFMHALGFAHEHLRPDNNTSCKPQGSTTAADTFGTPYDPNSIMNAGYCSGPGSTLSPWDVVGLQRAYGRKPYLSLVGTGNKCVDIENPSLTAPLGATRLQAYDCLQNNNQAWWMLGMLTPQTADGELVAPYHFDGAGYYATMDVEWGNSANGTKVWNWQLNGGAAQQWKFHGVAIVGMGELCLEVSNGTFQAGQPVILGTCNQSSRQRWDYFHNLGNRGWYSRPSDSPSYCLTKTGQNVTLQPCDYASATQQASQAFRPLGGRISTNPYNCLDVTWANPAPGNAVGLVTCRPSDGSDPLEYAQRWRFRGPIRGLASKCLDVDVSANPIVENGTKVQIWGCNSSLNQTFDYHF